MMWKLSLSSNVAAAAAAQHHVSSPSILRDMQAP